MFRNLFLVLVPGVAFGQTVFEKARGQADVFYDGAPLATAYETSYQSLKSSLEKVIS